MRVIAHTIAMRVRIFANPKKTTQSGRATIGQWVLHAELDTPRVPEPLMGWVSAGDTHKEIRLSFDSAEEAISFAKSNGWDYTVSQQAQRRVRPRNYGDNFVYRAVEE